VFLAFSLKLTYLGLLLPYLKMHHQQNISINHVIDKLSRRITTAILDIKEKEKKK